MKKKTKILIGLILALSLLSALAVSAFASEGSGVSEAPDTNAFSEIYSFALENADKIFSLLAFIGALILAISYKKGLFPFVQKALSALNGAVKSLREESLAENSQNNEFIKSLSEKLKSSESTLNEALEKLSVLETELKKSADACCKTEEFRAILTAEVEMIYDIFLNSSLPQYQKDRVGEAYCKMKRALEAEED